MRMNEATKPSARCEEAFASIKAAVGAKGWTADPAEMAPRLRDERGLWQGGAALLVRPASTAETAAVVRICAEAGIPIVPQGGNTYGPGNLYRDGAAAWCEGAPGSGRGEYIRILYAEPVRFRSLLIGNGYAKSKQTFFANARARTVRIETADGLSFAAELRDTEAMQTIRLPRVVQTATLRVEIVDVYGGDRHPDLCLHFLSPDFEEMDRQN